MTNEQIKELFRRYTSMQRELEALKKIKLYYRKNSIAADYMEKDLYLNLLSEAMKILSEKEQFIIRTHLIDHKTWSETVALYESRYGIVDGRSERTLKRRQTKAIMKLLDFINQLPLDFNDVS